MDVELKDMLISIQKSIINLQNDMTDVKNTVSKLQNDMTDMKNKVNKIELTLENETNKKIDALFDGRVDEIRHRKENIETIAKVANLEMRVDNLEKAFKVS